MPMNYEELDEKTREHMLSEFENEEKGPNPFKSKALSEKGLLSIADILRTAIQSGNDETLFNELNNQDYWRRTETYVRQGIARERKINVQQAAHRFATTEYSTWYVRGLSKKLLEEGVATCEVYRGEAPKWEPGECADHEGQIVSPKAVYDGHRARYWPEPGNSDAFSIPFGPGCHHVIRRVK